MSHPAPLNLNYISNAIPILLHTHTHAHTHICTHTHTHMYTHAHTHTHTHTHALTGEPAFFDIVVSPPSSPPVDMYLLLDLSLTMQQNLDMLRTLAAELGKLAS